jgi:hypothetical protein
MTAVEPKGSIRQVSLSLQFEQQLSLSISYFVELQHYKSKQWLLDRRDDLQCASSDEQLTVLIRVMCL